MTLEEMKIAVCMKMPGLIICRSDWEFQYWKSDKRIINWRTEGLHICHEAEDLIKDEDWQTYIAILRSDYLEATRGFSGDGAYSATCRQRLKALCKIWFPERFN